MSMTARNFPLSAPAGSPAGVNLSWFAGTLASAVGGAVPRVLVTLAHPDDESGCAALLHKLTSTYGPSSVRLLFTTNGDGAKGGKPVEAQRQFGAMKTARAVEAARSALGVFDVHVLGGSEVLFYNSFIMNSVSEEIERTGNVPAALPKGFLGVKDRTVPFYRTAQWIYRHIADFEPNVVITGDRMFTVQMHDWTNIVTRLAISHHQRLHPEWKPFLFAMPQQNKRGEDPYFLYRYPPHLEAVLPNVFRLELTPEDRRVKNRDLRVYAKGAVDLMLFAGYAALLCWHHGISGVRHLKRNDYLRLVGQDEIGDLVRFVPPLAEMGFATFEGNDVHYIPHTFRDDFTNISGRLLQMMRMEPFSTGDLSPEANDPFKGITAPIEEFLRRG